jgi:UDP-glucose 4-epimerase
MRILVTGGAGYIGSVACRVLAESGHSVAVFDNLSQGHRAAIPKGTRLFKGDLADKTQIGRALKTFRPDCVMHFAASIQVEESVANPAKYFHNNVVNGLNLLNAMVENRVPRIIFSSSAAVYGVPQKLPVREDAPLQPFNPYGGTKRIFEILLEEYHKAHGLNYISIRYFNVLGAYGGAGEDHHPETHIVPLILKAALGSARTFRIFGEDYDTPDGTCVRDYVHVYDLARAHILAMTAPIKADVFNLGSEHGFSVREVFETARKVTGREIPFRIVGRRAGDVPRLVASARKIRRDLGWKPVRGTLEQMLGDAWEWHRLHPDGYADHGRRKQKSEN